MIAFKEESPKGWEIVLKTNKKIKNYNREFLRTRKRDAHPDIGGIQTEKTFLHHIIIKALNIWNKETYLQKQVKKKTTDPHINSGPSE